MTDFALHASGNGTQRPLMKVNQLCHRAAVTSQVDPETDIGRIKIPQRSSLWACRDVLSFRSEGPRSKHSRL
jgi:hypothetical protein